MWFHEIYRHCCVKNKKCCDWVTERRVYLL